MSSRFEVKTISDIKKNSEHQDYIYSDVKNFYNSIIEINSHIPDSRKVWIYFIKEYNIIKNIGIRQTLNIKIGITRNPKKRMESLQSGNCNDLYFDIVFRSIPSVEKMIHDFFYEENIRGEWFKLSDRLKYFTDLFYYTKDFQWMDFNN